MALDQEKRLGIHGLNLGTDPAQLAVGALTLADGVRFLEAGALHSRNGRLRARLEFPDEGFGTPSTYTETIDPLVAPARVRGMIPFYDQRIETRLTTPPPDIPQRLNFLYKSEGRLYFNNDFQGSGSGIVGGDGNFANVQSRAKFVAYRDRVYIVDAGMRPKVFQRLPKAEQAALARVKYDVRNTGVRWPTADSHKPTASTVSPSGATAIPAGVFRFRIILENKNGTQSNPSMPHTLLHTNGTAFSYHLVDWSAIIATFPGGTDAITKVRVYVQFQADLTAATEPSSYVLIRSVATTNQDNGADPAGSIRYTLADHQSLSVHPLMPLAQGAPPKLLDIHMVGDIAFGIAAADEVYRETPLSEGERNLIATYWSRPGLPGLMNPGVGPGWAKLYDTTTIKALPVTQQHVFWSMPGQPDYMEESVVVGGQSELCVGLASAGNTCIIFTNQAIYTLAVFPEVALKRVHSRVGCLSRDSIVETEQGIRFLGSDGIPRIFNGATVDEISNELIPIFDREDYAGDHNRFDRAQAQECQGTFGDRKFYFTYPVTVSVPGYAKPGTYIDQSLLRNLAIGDASRGQTAWTIDRVGSYEMVYWLGRESRMLGIETSGAFFFMEEGFVDQQHAIPDEDIVYDIKFRKFASAQGLQGQFFRVAIDADTNGETLNVQFTCDDVLVHGTTFSTDRRDEVKKYVPATFKGRYLDVRIFGTVSSRVAVYGVTVELAPRGVF